MLSNIFEIIVSAEPRCTWGLAFPEMQSLPMHLASCPGPKMLTAVPRNHVAPGDECGVKGHQCSF